MKRLNNQAINELIRFGIVGATSNGLLYLGYLLITYYGVEKKTAMTLMYIIGVAIGFFANHRWTFAQRHNTGALFRYAKMHCAGYMINFFWLLIFADYFNFPHELVQITAIIIVAIFSFIVCKYYVFRAQPI